MQNFPSRKKISIQFFFILQLTIVIGISLLSSSYANSTTTVVINEIAWMGTQTSANDEWIELYNTSSQQVDLSGWTLKASDGSPNIQLSGVIAAKSYYILERQNDDTLPQIPADQIYNGTLNNNGESLQLIDITGNVIDEIDQWYAGVNSRKATMERSYVSLSGNQSNNWTTSTGQYNLGFGTPKAINSIYTAVSEGEQLNNISESEGSINIWIGGQVYD